MKQNRWGYAFIAPATIHLIVFAIAPILYVFYLSLHEWNLLRETHPFAGFGNYFALFQNDKFWNAMLNSARFGLFSVPLGMALALAVAILVNRNLPGMSLFRTIFYIPAISSGVAISMLWIYVYLPKNGLLNLTASALGLSNETDFLNKVEWAMPALVFMSLWTGLGPKMVVYLAGLVGIPPSLYEAAELDGAGKWRQFASITWPMLSPTSLFVLVTSTIGSFQLFTPIYMMTKGGPLDSTDVVGYHIYTEAWRRFDLGRASAQSFVLLAIIALVAAVQYKLMKRNLEAVQA